MALLLSQRAASGACGCEGGRLRQARLTVRPREKARGRWGQARSGGSFVHRRSLPPAPPARARHRAALVARRDFPHSVPALPTAGSLSLLVMENVERGRARPGQPCAPRPLKGHSPDGGSPVLIARRLQLHSRTTC